MGNGYCWTLQEVIYQYGRATAIRLLDYCHHNDDAGQPIWLDEDLANGLGLIEFEDQQEEPES
jgi:hypothetical protein